MAIDSGTVLILITVLVIPVAAVSFARSGDAWREIGRGDLAIEPAPEESRDGASAGARRAVQEAEARQMLEASSYRRLQRGEAPIDVEAELTRLLEQDSGVPAGGDDELREEVRRLVIARNERRARRGEAALDVEAEVERQLAEFA